MKMLTKIVSDIGKIFFFENGHNAIPEELMEFI